MAEGIAIVGAIVAGTELVSVIFKLLSLTSILPGHASSADKIRTWVDEYLFLAAKLDELRHRDGYNASDYYGIQYCQKEARSLGDILLPFSSAVQQPRRSRLKEIAFVICTGKNLELMLESLRSNLTLLAATQTVNNQSIFSIVTPTYVRSEWILVDLNSRSDFGISLREQGRLPESEEIHKYVFQSRRRILGSRHPETVKSKANLAVVINDLGRHKEAERMYRAALRSFRHSLERSHLDVLKTRANLADTLHDQGNYLAAEVIVVATLQMSSTRYGICHAQTLRTMEHHASLLHHMGYRNAAREVALELYETRARYFGERNEDTRRARAHVRSLEEEISEGEA